MRVLILASLAVATVTPANGQTLDSSTLQGLQSALGSARSVSDSSGRRTSSPDRGNLAPGARLDTQEEQELRRREALQRLSQLYTPSLIEQDYRQRLGDDNLRQFGYELFQAGEAPTGVRSGAIGNDYVLGIGDEVQISFRGAQTSNETVFVDRDGRIITAGLPPVQAAGRTLGQVRSELQAQTKRTMLATDIFVSVGEVRSVSIFIGGEVARPGQYSLSSVTDIATALSQAGGVRRSGSLRQVRLVRAGGGTINVDLYGMFGIGSLPNVKLRDGDRIIVPVIGPTIAVVGAVARPGIYELRGKETISSVVAFSGGAVRQRGAQVVLSRIDADGTESFHRAADPGAPALGGDAIQVVGSSAGGAIGRVRLSGHVDNKGARPLMSAGTVADLVGSSENLRPDTYMLAAVLRRRDPYSGGQIYEVVNLASELRRHSSTALTSDDELVVFSRADIEFLNSSSVRKVVRGEDIDPYSCRALSNFRTLVKDSTPGRFGALTRGVFAGPGIDDTKKKAALEQTPLSSRLNKTVVAPDVPSERDLLLDPELRELQRREENRREFSRREDEERYFRRDMETRCPAIFDEQPELLPVLLDSAVSVGGAVRRSGVYPVGGTVTARDLSLVADGLLPGARGLMFDITYAVGGVERVEDGGSALQTTMLSAGDDIRFSTIEGVFEAKGVQLTGEVMRPGNYTIRKGERLSDLIQRAGGLSPQAYPYGTVFTRESVRKSQLEGFQRTARELNNSLLTIAARSRDGASGDGLAGAAAMIEALTNIEPTGRMVVEADPRVLAIRPDLDTVLEGGDTIHVPKQANFVLALGDVNNPGALQYVNGKTPAAYLSEAGGTLATADRKRAFIVLPDGTAQPIQIGGWSGGKGLPPPPGTTIIVPKNIDPLYRLTIMRDITTIVAQLATSAATVAILATR